MGAVYRWREPRWVYFAQQVPDGLIKIGHSQHPALRAQSLWPPDSGRRGTFLLATITLDPFLSRHHVQQEHEWRLHAQFSHARFVGEWFEPTPDLLAFIASLTTDAIAA